jgi:hypothetical protein
MFQLLRDERRINFKEAEHEALWLFLYRRSGMGKLEFKEVGPCLPACLDGWLWVPEG